MYIESQERLCLAQISNTLLKHFSYNEIHNRRVALGITCVQCTPVQLEILRRAGMEAIGPLSATTLAYDNFVFSKGAMPVSSRRCGMITRREAERLCKSFLGDNAPPRLPDDFSFSVYHECAWGCRGQFLPARYNSSRAKCIKCTYCGLFFSPNKFIFHSHRIGPGDKYVQPDAANFNSWRRHMKLSGVSPEEIVHAWEDVKAMFNGGTRKRMLTSTSSSTGAGISSPNSTSSSSSTGTGTGCTNGIMQHNIAPSLPSPKRQKEISSSSSSRRLSPPLLQVATAAAVNVFQQYPRPVNLLTSKMNGGCTGFLKPTSINTVQSGLPSAISSDISQSLQFSRTFMMDYMWHSQQHQQNSHTQKSPQNFHFPTYSFPWLKRPPATILFNQAQPYLQHNNENDHVNINKGNEKAAPGSTLQFYKSSAFTPVLAQRSQFLAAELSSAAECIPNHNKCRTEDATSIVSDDEFNNNKHFIPHNGNNNRDITEDEIISSEDEMVDIETTEEHQSTTILYNNTNDSNGNDIISIPHKNQNTVRFNSNIVVKGKISASDKLSDLVSATPKNLLSNTLTVVQREESKCSIDVNITSSTTQDQYWTSNRLIGKSSCSVEYDNAPSLADHSLLKLSACLKKEVSIVINIVTSTFTYITQVPNGNLTDACMEHVYHQIVVAACSCVVSIFDF